MSDEICYNMWSMKAVVVLSGGQDSATALAMAVKKYTAAEVAAITFRYGQKHEKEVTYAKGLARHFSPVGGSHGSPT